MVGGFGEFKLTGLNGLREAAGDEGGGVARVQVANRAETGQAGGVDLTLDDGGIGLGAGIRQAIAGGEAVTEEHDDARFRCARDRGREGEQREHEPDRVQPDRMTDEARRQDIAFEKLTDADVTAIEAIDGVDPDRDEAAKGMIEGQLQGHSVLFPADLEATVVEEGVDVIALGGGLPILVGTDKIGGLGVSGAPVQEADEKCATAGLAAVASALK